MHILWQAMAGEIGQGSDGPSQCALERIANMRTAEAIRYLMSGSHTIFHIILEDRKAGKDISELWQQWVTLRHAIDHLQSSWPTAAQKIPPAKEATVAQVPQRNIRQ